MKFHQQAVSLIAKDRDSNFEILRIVLMIMIVFHHYCVNSGLTKMLDLANITYNTILIQFMSIGGKTGVNGFFILSGYFMINRHIQMGKVLKLYFEVWFYNITVAIFLQCLGYSLDNATIVHCFIPLLLSFPETFIGAYLFVYLLSPVINTGANHLDRKKYGYLLSILILYFSILETFLFLNTWNYFGWAVTMYLVGGYIRLQKNELFKRKWLWFSIVVLCMAVIWISQLIVDFCGKDLGVHHWSYLMTNANKFPVFVMALALFLFFKNIKIRNSKLINTIAASSFGVLLIHANNNTMRQWLWKDFFKNTEFYHTNLLWIHMIFSVAVIYVVCTGIDICRIKFIEIPLFSFFKRKRTAST